MNTNILLPLLLVTAATAQYQQQPPQRVAPGVPPQKYQNQQVPQNQPGRVAPGVPPQQYQNQQVPQHVPNHQGQAPQHVPQKPPPPQHGGHYNKAKMMDASNVLKEREHIQEHMDVPIDTSKMTESELQFHYFKMHDADNNNKLDGCELVKSVMHWHDESKQDPNGSSNHEQTFQDQELIDMVDPILQQSDKNRDGMIDYGEFIQSQNIALR